MKDVTALIEARLTGRECDSPRQPRDEGSADQDQPPPALS